ncbi:hypothetical protein CFIMG_004383RAa [Ceratocystis fimbriata CBS 114723]|uniref:Uncharacterized protein n=1 Tax=Ceratocystis fimbriata CBS 114723 TaxID=1035309 RepID=A0A2C5WXI0_9PEZI|nr:hypothetical protein CFIMG_004383RAa [Ceratocystis fimbriata CBS 114723]
MSLKAGAIFSEVRVHARTWNTLGGTRPTSHSVVRMKVIIRRPGWVGRALEPIVRPSFSRANLNKHCYGKVRDR